mgnify:CR=1 FL=1
MIKDIIFVEDGSVDVDELNAMFGKETHIIVYRQGSCKPTIQHLENPLKTSVEEYISRGELIECPVHLGDKVFKVDEFAFDNGVSFYVKNIQITINKDNQIVFVDDGDQHCGILHQNVFIQEENEDGKEEKEEI